MTKELELIVTLWPTFSHFEKTATDERIAGIRMNSVVARDDVEAVLADAVKRSHDMPLYLDIKGRQMRVREVVPRDDRCEVIINHPISVAKLPVVALFKGGNDPAKLAEIKDGTHLVFSDGPQYRVKPGESLHIRDASLQINGTIPEYEQQLIRKALGVGVERFMLSYVERASDIEEFRKYAGDCELVAKIESLPGLRYVKQEYVKTQNTALMAARGDLFVEVSKPHKIVAATKAIVRADPDAIAASRIMLSVTNEPVPSCADFGDLAMLLDSGYRRLMLCDGLCMKPDALERAINIVESYAVDSGYRLVRQRSKPVSV
ncbi:hypothetical protein HY642_01995 [Candidatus Woesearchaeota archaeon]|nr:hypothetical protein [Candidatus Woesearchaeota archaeon]